MFPLVFHCGRDERQEGRVVGNGDECLWKSQQLSEALSLGAEWMEGEELSFLQKFGGLEEGPIASEGSWHSPLKILVS